MMKGGGGGDFFLRRERVYIRRLEEVVDSSVNELEQLFRVKRKL